jgi:hypothetical protein
METWFYSGTFMKDGSPITIAARSEFQARECLRMGFKPLEDVKSGKTRTVRKTGARPGARAGARKKTAPSS